MINAEKLRHVMRIQGYSSAKLAEAINHNYSEVALKKYDIDNLLQYSKVPTAKTRRKLVMIANILGHLPDDFMDTPEEQEAHSALPYDSARYKQILTIIETLLEEQKLSLTVHSVQEFASETYHYAIKRDITDNTLLEAFIEGLLRNALRMGVVLRRTV